MEWFFDAGRLRAPICTQGLVLFATKHAGMSPLRPTAVGCFFAPTRVAAAQPIARLP
jgi:hypothetical protein